MQHFSMVEKRRELSLALSNSKYVYEYHITTSANIHLFSRGNTSIHSFFFQMALSSPKCIQVIYQQLHWSRREEGLIPCARPLGTGVESAGPNFLLLLLRFNQNFGVLGVLDRLHGTDSKFRQTKQYERHALLTSFTPLTESIPDAPKKLQWSRDQWTLTSGEQVVPKPTCDKQAPGYWKRTAEKRNNPVKWLIYCLFDREQIRRSHGMLFFKQLGEKVKGRVRVKSTQPGRLLVPGMV